MNEKTKVINQADAHFYYTCKKILTENLNDYDQNVRPKWKDGKPAHTVKAHFVKNEYDLSKEFPMPTLRKLNLNNAMAEIVWIWSKKSNNVKDLKRADGTQIHIWDAWADSDGSIGKAYGYQLARKNKKQVIESTIIGSEEVNGKPLQYVEIEGRKFYCNKDHRGRKYIEVDQVDSILYDLKNAPANRRMLTSMFNHDELFEMNLEPCAYSMSFMVDTQNNKLDAMLIQRSQDMLTANGWNVAQYAGLVHMFARATGYQPGKLVHMLSNPHIYDRHIPLVEEMLKEYKKGNVFKAPKVILNPNKKGFYEIDDSDFKIEGYEYNKNIENIKGQIEVAE